MIDHVKIRNFKGLISFASGLRMFFALLASVVGSQSLAMSASSPVGFAVCARNCALGDVGCVAAEATCNTKIASYLIYMEQMGAGVTRHQFPDVYRDILAARFPQSSFNNVRFGFSDRQPPNNTTTDCNTIYFGNADYVDSLRKASANSNYHLLLHELTHTEQCTVAGSREAYARRWWDEMEVALAAQGRKVNFAQPPEELAKQFGTLYSQGHDMMPMERQADKKADALLPLLRQCCISHGGSPIRPLTLTGIEERSDGGSSVRRILTARTANGDAPFTSRWWIKSPGDAAPIEQPQSLVKGTELLWTPNNNQKFAEVVTSAIDQRRVWRHEIRVVVRQQSTALETKEATRVISFSDRVFTKLPKTGPKFDKLPAELPPSKLPEGLPTPTPSKPGPTPGPFPSKSPVGP